jgi:hypothetical protein
MCRYCFDCIENWSSVSNQCPLCKLQFRFISVSVLQTYLFVFPLLLVLWDALESINEPTVLFLAHYVDSILLSFEGAFIIGENFWAESMSSCFSVVKELFDVEYCQSAWSWYWVEHLPTICFRLPHVWCRSNWLKFFMLVVADSCRWRTYMIKIL